jgi:hypothetical protein
VLSAELEAVPKRLWQFLRALSFIDSKAALPFRQAPFAPHGKQKAIKSKQKLGKQKAVNQKLKS